VGQQRPSVHVSDGVEPVSTFNPQVVSGLEEAAALEADGFQSEVFDMRSSSDRDQKLGCAEAAAVLEIQLRTAGFAAGLDRPGAGHDLDTVPLLQGCFHLLAGDPDAIVGNGSCPP